MFTIRLGILAAPILSVGLLAAGPASASVTAPTRISPTGRIVTDTALATGGGRTAIVMASTTPHLRGAVLDARMRTSSGAPSLQRIDSGRTEPRVAVGADGTAVAAWVSFTSATTTLKVARARPGERFGSPQVLATVNGTERAILLGGVVVRRDGSSVVAWRPNFSPPGTLFNSGTPVQVSTAPAGAAFGAPQTLGSSLYSAPVLGLAPDDSAIVGWSYVPDAPLPPPAVNVPGRFATYLAALPPGATSFGQPREYPITGGASSGVLRLATGSSGVAVAHQDRSGLLGVSMLNPDGTLSPAATLPAAGQSSTSSDLSISLLPGSAVDALWLSTRKRSPQDDRLRSARVFASRQAPAGAFAAPEQLSTPGWLAGPPTAATIAERTVAIWGEARDRRSRVVVAVRGKSGNWTKHARISVPDLRTYDVDAAAGTSAITLIWLQHVGPPSQPGGIAYRATYRP